MLVPLLIVNVFELYTVVPLITKLPPIDKSLCTDRLLTNTEAELASIN